MRAEVEVCVQLDTPDFRDSVQRGHVPRFRFAHVGGGRTGGYAR